MDKPITASYTIASPKICSPLRILFFSDLHGGEFGEQNSRLLALIREVQPDLILCGGDISVAKTRQIASAFMEQLPDIAPTYLTNGNHESELRRDPEVYRSLEERLRSAGIHLLNNETENMTLRGSALQLIGLELPLQKYKKLRIPHLAVSEIHELVGESDPSKFSILLAHSPAFVPQYLAYGADLSLSGHYHGGIARLWKQQVLISPYGFPFPNYGYGQFRQGDHTAIVTAGLGEHTIPFRIHNPEEIVLIDLTPESASITTTHP